MQLSTALRDAIANLFESTIGTAPILRGRSGAAPANLAAASSGTVLFSCTLPSDWLAASSGGSKAQAGTWQDTTADANGTLGHWELVGSDGTTRHAQGTVSVIGGGGELQVLSLTITAGQPVSLTSGVLGTGNA